MDSFLTIVDMAKGAGLNLRVVTEIVRIVRS